MSKNLTRKGLALGAVVALGSTLFAGTPASAATAISLDTAFGASGTTQNGVLGNYFTLASTLTGGAAGDLVKFYVEGVAGANITAKTRLTTDVAGTTTGNAYTTTTGTVGALVTTQNKVATVSDALKQATIIPNDTYAAGKIAQVGISLDAAALDATTTIKVTAFIDNGVTNNKPGDAGEVASAPVSITFHKGSTLTATPTIKTITVGSAVKATVAVSNSVNVEQFRAAADGGHAEYPFTVAFKENGSTTWASSTAYTGVDAIWNTTDKEFVAAAGNAVAAKTYGATAKINGTDSAAATSSTATAGDVLTLSAVSIAAGSSYRSTSSTNAPTTADVLRAGSGSFTAESAVATVDAGKSKAGQKVTFKIEEIDPNGSSAKTSSLASGASIVAGGKTLTDSDTTTTQSISVEVVSDANGDVSLPITYTGLKADNSIRISATATGATGAISATSKTVVGQDSKPQAIVNAATAQAGTAVMKFAKGGAISVPFQVVDQFGQVPAGTYQVVFSALTGVNYTSTVALGSDGKVTFAGTSTHTAAATGLTLTATLQKKDTAGNFNNITGTSITTNTTIDVGTVQSAKTISVATGNLGSTTGTAAVQRALSSALNAGNADLHQGSVAQTTAGGITITSTVLDTEGANAIGVAVTYTAAGVLFKAGNNYGLGSITVLTDSSGTTGAVSAFSNLTGEVDVVITSGSASKTQKLTFSKATTGGSAWTVTAPANILPGQSLKVTAVLKDKFGGVVNTSGTADSVKVVYTGPGYVTKDMPTTTDSDGVVSFTVLLGAADSGTATVKITYAGADNITAATAADDVVATASIIIGAAPVTTPAATAAVSGSTGKFFVSATNAGGKKVVVKVAGKFFRSFSGTTAKKTVALKAPKGKHKVTVFVGGKLVSTKTITVK